MRIRKLLYVLPLLIVLSGCADTLMQITLTHVRAYKVSESTPLPETDAIQDVKLQKVIDIDLAKTAEAFASLIEKAFSTVIGLGDMLFKGITTALIVEGPPVPYDGA